MNFIYSNTKSNKHKQFSLRLLFLTEPYFSYIPFYSDKYFGD